MLYVGVGTAHPTPSIFMQPMSFIAVAIVVDAK